MDSCISRVVWKCCKELKDENKYSSHISSFSQLHVISSASLVASGMELILFQRVY